MAIPISKSVKIIKTIVAKKGINWFNPFLYIDMNNSFLANL